MSPAESIPEGVQCEAKFVLSAGRAGSLLSLLRQRCRLDSAHPANVVSSLYYDTRDRRSLHEKNNSDFLKTKVRLRWYTELDGEVSTSGSFLEVKQRVGVTRAKVRIVTPYEPAWLDRAPLWHPDLANAPRLLRDHGVRLPPLTPIFVVRYERHRFFDPASRLRVNLDRHVHVPAANPGALGPRFRAELCHAVLELKGRNPEELPRALHGALRLGCRRSSFSKYAACYLSVFGVTP